MISPVDHSLTVGGLVFHYVTWGSEAAPPVVLLHGITGHARSWDALSRDLSTHVRVIALDQRGHGDSGWGTKATYQLEELYKDLRAVIEARGLSRYTLIGHSLGGRVSIEIVE